MKRLRQPDNGFTLIEVMIAMLIGIIGIVVMMQTFAVSEGFKRTATSGTDAQVNGSVALYMLEREVRTAGYGMNGYLPAIGAAPTNTYCNTVRVWNAAAGTGRDVRILPFEINPAGIPAGDANTDVIVVGYGTSDSVVAGVQADQTSTGGAATSPINVLSSKDGFRNGDLIVSVQPGTPASCVLHELTQTPGAAGSCGSPSAGSTLVHGTSGYPTADKSQAMCSVVTPKFNSGSGIKDSGGVTVPVLNNNTGAQVFNLGIPSVKAYAIRGGNLTSCDILQLDCTNTANYTVVVNDIVSLRAVYGRDTNNPQDFQVDVWDRTALPNARRRLLRCMAVMFEIVARSGVKEKPSPGSTSCDALTDPTRPDKGATQDWIGGVGSPGIAQGIGIDLSLSAPPGAPATDWKCYRYRLYQTRVPIRNMTWRP